MLKITNGKGAGWMDCIVYNAHIITLDGQTPHATAMAIEKGKIVAVGDSSLLAARTQNTKMIDAQNRYIYPGFGDSHMHVLNYGETLTQVDLSGLDSIEALIARVQDFLRQHRVPDGVLVYSSGWNQDLFAEKRIPTRKDLDRISTVHPIVLSRICGHCTVVNTKALEQYGITEHTPQPFGGRFELGSDGKPNGIFHETAQQLVRRERPVTRAQVKAMIQTALKQAAAHGLTCIHSDDLASIPGLGWLEVHKAYLELEQEGKLPVRIVEQCRFASCEELQGFLDEQVFYGQGSDVYRLGPIKIIGDGSLGARTAWLREPYSDDSSTRGVSAIQEEELEGMIRLAHQHDWPVAVHAIGDKTIQTVMDCIARVQSEQPKPIRHGIVHCQITDSSLLKRFAREDIATYIQPIFLEYDLHIAEKRVGARAKTSYAWKTLVESGALVCGGSDCPVEPLDVLKNMHCAVMRQDFYRQPAEGWHPEQRLTMQQALPLYTTNIAVLEGRQALRGSLSIGKWADFVMLDRDILQNPNELLNTNVCMTAMQGQVTYQSQR